MTHRGCGTAPLISDSGGRKFCSSLIKIPADKVNHIIKMASSRNFLLRGICRNEPVDDRTRSVLFKHSEMHIGNYELALGKIFCLHLRSHSERL